MQFGKRNRPSPAINIAPLVDVVFLLVIFFAVSTTFLETSGLDLELPESSSTAGREPEALTVLLAADGTLSFDDRTVDREELRRALAEALEPRAPARRMVVLRADTKTEHGDVVELMDLIRGAGASGLTVAARPASGS